MIANLAGVVWKKLPWTIRKKLVRLTQPKFTISVAAIITNKTGEVLLLDHLIRPASGWGLPGGFLEHGEQPAEGIRREIIEETAMEISDLRMVRLRTIGTHLEVLFRGRSVGQPEAKSSEIKALGWFSVSLMPEEMNSTQKMLIAQVLNEEI